MKRLIALLAAALCLVAGNSLNAQVTSNPKLTALTKPNPAQPIHLASCVCTDIGDDQLSIDFELDGIGFWCFYLIDSVDGQTCVIDWTRSGGQPTECTVTVRKSTYVGCFCNLENVHGLPPFFGPYKTH